jgi:hypothetical protein
MRAHVIYIIIITLLIIAGYFSYESFRNKSAELEARKSAETDLVREIDEQGREIVRKSAVIIQKDKSLKELMGVSEQMDGLIKSVQAMKGKLNWAASFSTTTEVNATGLVEHVKRDTIEALVVSYDDGWNRVYVEVNDSSYTLDLNVSADFTLIEKSFSPWFKKNYSEVMGKSGNPHLKFNDLNTITVRHEQKKLSLAAFVGVGLSGEFKPEPQLGVGLAYDILQIK